MTIKPLFSLRRIIPRWRDSTIALYSGELAYFQKQSGKIKQKSASLIKKINNWENDPCIETGIELVSEVISDGNYGLAKYAAEYLLSRENQLHPSEVRIAKEVLVRLDGVPFECNDYEVISRNEIYTRINNIKRLLNDYPRNPILWVDLSRLYISLGQKIQSAASMQKGLFLAPENRFILRAASRLFVHLDMPDRAHKLLVSSEVTKYDPWLIAAEIAISEVASITPKFVRRGKSIIDNAEFSMFQTTELLSALGTLELKNGAIKNARKLFEASLISPTENSVAQTVWVKNDIPSLQTTKALETTPKSYEAKAINAFNNFEWESVVKQAWLWLADEAYSSRPAEAGSYAASLGLEDHETAEKLSRVGLIANPNDKALHNNLAFALANQGKLSEAIDIISSISNQLTEVSDIVCVTATDGFIDFRKNDYQSGKMKYLTAIEYAKKNNRPDLSALAAIYFAREMYYAREFTKSEAITFADNACKNVTSKQVAWLLSKLKMIN